MDPMSMTTWYHKSGDPRLLAPAHHHHHPPPPTHLLAPAHHHHHPPPPTTCSSTGAANLRSRPPGKMSTRSASSFQTFSSTTSWISRRGEMSCAASTRRRRARDVRRAAEQATATAHLADGLIVRHSYLYKFSYLCICNLY